MKNLIENLKNAYKAKAVAEPEILYNCSPDQEKYDKQRKVFNRRFQFMPAAIILCETAEQISVAVVFCSENGLPIRVKSGGHDHEGESSGTKTIVLDLVKMQKVSIDKANGTASIQPGIPFQNLTPILAKADVMVPHGTCATVCIAGFTMGGGWGPWTRQYGMACERLIEATVVLGDGSIVKVKQDDKNKKEKGLLWALKGGGGFSYGIVTEFVMRTFPLPKRIIKFQVEWNDLVYDKKAKKFNTYKPTPAMKILKAWEKMIGTTDAQANHMVGTNLQVSAQYAEKKVNAEKATNNCLMYGYWKGSLANLKTFINERFEGTGYFKITHIQMAGADDKEMKYDHRLMSNWDRFSHYNILQEMKGLEGKPFPPDYDAPSPHKITSRMVDKGGLKAAGHKKLIESLNSPLVLDGNMELGLFTYITLGAITGNFYQNEITASQKNESAFPYKDKLYTIQYQTWWNETREEKDQKENNEVYTRVNRALDWMEVCRNYDIPNTSGSFISFKDSSVPTATYFDKSYEDLIDVKKKYSKDPLNHFRTRKTII